MIILLKIVVFSYIIDETKAGVLPVNGTLRKLAGWKTVLRVIFIDYPSVFRRWIDVSSAIMLSMLSLLEISNTNFFSVSFFYSLFCRKKEQPVAWNKLLSKAILASANSHVVILHDILVYLLCVPIKVGEMIPSIGICT